MLDSKKYLEPEWDDVTREMQDFRAGYEKPQLYSLREYLLDNDPDEFQIDRVRDDIDFKGIWDAMQKDNDFYKLASVDGQGFDSDVREKLFAGMEDSLGLDYDDIYYKWLGKPRPKKQTKTPYELDNCNPKVTKKPDVSTDEGLDELQKDPKYWATRVLESPEGATPEEIKIAKFIRDKWGEY